MNLPARCRPLCRKLGLDVAQLHGSEKPDDYPEGIRVWKAFRIRTAVPDLDWLSSRGRTAGWTRFGRNFRLGQPASAPRPSGPQSDPGGRPERRKCPRSHRAGPALGRGRLLAAGKRAGTQGSRQNGGISQSRARGGNDHDASTRRGRPFRTLRRTVCPGGPDGAARRTGKRLSWRRAGPGVPSRAERPAAQLRRAGPRRCTSPGGSRRTWAAPASTSSAKTCCIPERTRSTTAWDRRCWRGAWARSAIIAETGAGQHGVATATVCALFGLECVVYMGEEDMRRQRLNVFRMRLLGAKVVGVDDRQPDPERRHQRSHAGLGDQRRATPTICSARRWARIPTR